jgi:spore maturation protein CgeB
LISKAKRRYYQDKAKNNRVHDPAKWYRSIYKPAGANSARNDLAASSGSELQELSEKLQEIFTVPWRNLSSSNMDLIEVESLLKSNNPSIPSIGQVKSGLAHLEARKATGSDSVHVWLLKRFSEDLAVVVHNIFISSIIQCKYPTSYKHDLISPVPKVFPPNDINTDFRQISVLPQLEKFLNDYR